MINPSQFIAALRAQGFEFFTGVPDSLLRHFLAALGPPAPDQGRHVIAANEGQAIALAAGHYLGTGQAGVVYLQNSGLGNALNPLVSLADPRVYRLPMLLLIGWRGEPGTPDEPQHQAQGQITEELLRLLGIPCQILGADSAAASVIAQARAQLAREGSPVALLIRRGTFAPWPPAPPPATATLSREAALRRLLDLVRPDDLIVATTGQASRELSELRRARQEPEADFLMVGSMGHASALALGVALSRPNRRVVCLDGDGALLMHLGALPTIGRARPANLVHILLNNEVHQSVGGQPTVAGTVDFAALSKACGYTAYYRADTLAALNDCWRAGDGQVGPLFIELRLSQAARTDLGRPTQSPEDAKRAFMAKAGHR